MDEPFSALDALTRGALQDEVVTLRAKTRQTTFMITHDVDEALLLADRILLMTMDRKPASRRSWSTRCRSSARAKRCTSCAATTVCAITSSTSWSRDRKRWPARLALTPGKTAGTRRPSCSRLKESRMKPRTESIGRGRRASAVIDRAWDLSLACFQRSRAHCRAVPFHPRSSKTNKQVKSSHHIDDDPGLRLHARRSHAENPLHQA